MIRSGGTVPPGGGRRPRRRRSSRNRSGGPRPGPPPGPCRCPRCRSAPRGVAGQGSSRDRARSGSRRIRAGREPVGERELPRARRGWGPSRGPRARSIASGLELRDQGRVHQAAGATGGPDRGVDGGRERGAHLAALGGVSVEGAELALGVEAGQSPVKPTKESLQLEGHRLGSGSRPCAGRPISRLTWEPKRSNSRLCSRKGGLPEAGMRSMIPRPPEKAVTRG